jgi:hypothetical protein
MTVRLPRRVERAFDRLDLARARFYLGEHAYRRERFHSNCGRNLARYCHHCNADLLKGLLLWIEDDISSILLMKLSAEEARAYIRAFVLGAVFAAQKR